MPQMWQDGSFCKRLLVKDISSFISITFSIKTSLSSKKKPKPRQTKYFETKYHKVKAKVVLLSSSASNPSSSSGKNKGLIAETNDWDDEEVSSDENEVSKDKALMALNDEERVLIGKESAKNGDWTKISMKKVHTLLEMEDNDDRKSFLNYLYNSDMSITSSNIPKSSETEDSTLPNQDTDEVPSNESQRNTIDPSIVVSDSLATDYDSDDESSVCSTPFLSLKKLDDAEPVFGPKTILSILKSKSTFKAETLNGIIINEPSSAPARGKNSLASKTNSAPTDKLKNMKMEDDPPFAVVMKELNELKIQINKKKSSYSRNKNAQQVPPNELQNRYKTQFKMNCDLCGQKNHLSENCYEVLFCKKCKRTNHITCDHAEFMSSMNANQHHIGQGESSSRSRTSRPSLPFPSCIYCGYNDHHSNDCLYYPTCEICGSYDHDTHGHNMTISLRRGINPRNPQHVTKNCETCSRNVHTTSDHNDIEWFRKRETLQAKNVESFKARLDLNGKAICETQLRGMFGSLMYLTVSRPDTQVSLISVYEIKQILRNPTLLLLRELSDFSALEKYFRYLSVAKKASLVDKVAMFSTETEDIATARYCTNILWT
ncbi:hypothetical protein Tco_1233423 [Tanacetum coccineum]